eukprot:scaffold47673_cov35-Prasinocladus_malaysianus.AAC.1
MIIHSIGNLNQAATIVFGSNGAAWHVMKITIVTNLTTQHSEACNKKLALYNGSVKQATTMALGNSGTFDHNGM